MSDRRLMPQDRYHTDVAFHSLVDMMEHFIHTCEYTPSEMREAAILAAIHYETRRGPSQIIIEGDMTISQFLGRTEFTEKEKQQAKERRMKEIYDMEMNLKKHPNDFIG